MCAYVNEFNSLGCIFLMAFQEIHLSSLDLDQNRAKCVALTSGFVGYG